MEKTEKHKRMLQRLELIKAVIEFTELITKAIEAKYEPHHETDNRIKQEKTFQQCPPR